LIEWFATAVGIAGGLMLSYSVATSVLPTLLARSRRPVLVTKLSFGGAVIAALPALLLSMVIGAPLGSGYGAVGIAAGVALVFAIVLLAGTFAGVLLAKLLTRPGA
jgi:hypothetical protein